MRLPEESLNEVHLKIGAKLGLQKPDLYLEELQIEENKIFLVGTSCLSDSGEVIGSSASQKGFEVERAYFELIERFSILKASTVSSNGNPNWAISKSNGVSFGSSFEHAKINAYLEMVERDRVLRSWYGDPIHPVQIEKVGVHIPSYFLKQFDGGFYQFIETNRTVEEKVVGLFLIPKLPNKNVIMGFGASNDMTAAIGKAWNEGLQRFGFTQECEDESEIIFSPSPHFHLDFFNQPTQKNKLENWLNGKTFKPSLLPKQKNQVILNIQDFTPKEILDSGRVIKVTSDQYYQLYFGQSLPIHSSDVDSERRIHPIS